MNRDSEGRVAQVTGGGQGLSTGIAARSTIFAACAGVQAVSVT